jgi:hypothetical protein
MRLTIPGFKDIYREERNLKICNLFNGANHKELGIMFDLTEGRIRDSEQKGMKCRYDLLVSSSDVLTPNLCQLALYTC